MRPRIWSDVALRIPRVVVRIAPGPAWTSGRPEDQAGWSEHAAFINDLIDRGVFIMGGPWTNRLGSMSLWEGMDAEEVRRVQETDPFVVNGVFEIEEIADWTVYVDTRVE
ncbi:MAG TPA: YciI family protein [Gaiellaceae bacterium]